MTTSDLDVIVVGAGAAGIAALRELSAAGLNVICLEARNRIGGRIHTIHDEACPVPIELGAEFIHGRPPELWEMARRARLPIYEGSQNMIQVAGDKHVRMHEMAVDELFEAMGRQAAEGDRSFHDFLESAHFPEEAKHRARGFVEGFNAADSRRISIVSLAQDEQASGEIEGDRAFRFLKGYDSVPRFLATGHWDRIRLNTEVTAINWQPGTVTVSAKSSLTGAFQTIKCRRIVITVPLGVLQHRAIQFHPEPTEHWRAADRLVMGQVFRVVLRFRDAFWQHHADLRDPGFLISDLPLFPTWWTTLPVHAPVIVGWSAGPHAVALLGRPQTEIIQEALQALSQIAREKATFVDGMLETASVHDWHADPFARGSYSYVPVGAADARGSLAAPIENTLYFSGEATELNGHSATVHGAIATGRRVATQILQAS